VRGWSEKVETRLEYWITDEGSGLDLERITAHNITISRVVVPQAIGRYVAYPANARGRHLVFNPNSDNDCVIQSIAAGKLLASGTSLKNMHRRVDTPDKCARHVIYDPQKLPISWETLGELERDNNLSLYVYSILKNLGEKDNRYSLSQVRKGRDDNKKRVIIHLLLLENEHACLITNFNRFVDAFTYRGRTSEKHFCRTCFSPYHTQAEADNHSSGCKS